MYPDSIMPYAHDQWCSVYARRTGDSNWCVVEGTSPHLQAQQRKICGKTFRIMTFINFIKTKFIVDSDRRGPQIYNSPKINWLAQYLRWYCKLSYLKICAQLEIFPKTEISLGIHFGILQCTYKHETFRMLFSFRFEEVLYIEKLHRPKESPFYNFCPHVWIGQERKLLRLTIEIIVQCPLELRRAALKKRGCTSSTVNNNSHLTTTLF